MVSKPVFRAATPADAAEVLAKLAYLQDPANAEFIQCREQRHWWKKQHEGWMRARSTDPYQKTYACVGGCGCVKVVKRIDGVYVTSYYPDPNYGLKGARLTCQDIRDYEIAQLEAQGTSPKAPKTPKAPSRSRTSQVTARTAKPSTVSSARKR